jgi:protein-tyrosine phosphatase
VIDLHLHLLPGVDDGPPDMDASLALARALVEAGVTRAVVTPHIDDWTAQVLPDVAAVQSRTETLAEEIARADIALSITPGGECFLTPELIERARERTVPTWGCGPCILVEMVATQRLLHVDRMLAGLLRCGLRVVLAHPERYPFVQENPDALNEPIDNGLMLQVTAAAFGYERSRQGEAARTLLARGKVHLLASDAHNPSGVQSVLIGLARLRELAGDEVVRTLYEENPLALLDGDRPVTTISPLALSTRRSFRLPFLKWR